MKGLNGVKIPRGVQMVFRGPKGNMGGEKCLEGLLGVWRGQNGLAGSQGIYNWSRDLVEPRWLTSDIEGSIGSRGTQ